jgi:hypothetical protein
VSHSFTQIIIAIIQPNTHNPVELVRNAIKSTYMFAFFVASVFIVHPLATLRGRQQWRRRRMAVAAAAARKKETLAIRGAIRQSLQQQQQSGWLGKGKGSSESLKQMGST